MSPVMRIPMLAIECCTPSAVNVNTGRKVPTILTANQHKDKHNPSLPCQELFSLPLQKRQPFPRANYPKSHLQKRSTKPWQTECARSRDSTLGENKKEQAHITKSPHQQLLAHQCTDTS